MTIKTVKITQPIIVIGMHRSGTSLTSNILIKLGVNMGDKLLGKTFSNPLGHFEDIDFLELNEEILISAGGDHLNPPGQDAIANQFNKYKARIKKLIELKAKKTVYGWKDPRTCLTFNLFLPFIGNPYIIYCKRDANEIAQSLYKRQKIEITDGLKLTRRYESEINNTFNQNPTLQKLEINHNKLIQNTEDEINRIVKFLKIEIDKSTMKKAVACVKPNSKISRMVKRRKVYEKTRDEIMHIIAKIEFKILTLFGNNNKKS